MQRLTVSQATAGASGGASCAMEAHESTQEPELVDQAQRGSVEHCEGLGYLAEHERAHVWVVGDVEPWKPGERTAQRASPLAPHSLMGV